MIESNGFLLLSIAHDQRWKDLQQKCWELTPYGVFIMCLFFGILINIRLLVYAVTWNFFKTIQDI